MSDLAQRIITAVQAKEVAAMATTGLKWRTHDTWVSDGGHCAVVMNEKDKPLVAWLPTFTFPGWDVPGPWADASFIADNDPESVLRRCEADREIVALHIRIWLEPGAPEFNDAHLTSEPMPVCASCRPETMFRRAESWPCRTLLALARGYGIQP